MPDFDEVRFPTAIARGAVGGPERRTEIVALVSGHEERNTPWADSRRRYDIGYGIRSADDLAAVVAFFEARAGRLRGFRFKDWSDYKSCTPSAYPAATDQAIGIGTGALATFQLVKHYTSGVRTWVRAIRKPVAGSIAIAVNGDPKIPGTHFNADSTTGVVTFTAGNIPVAGQAVTAGYDFDVPVRFDTDLLQTTLTVERMGEIRSIPLIEVRT
jgi:uncharacterized protein (TIGR02217 family)